MMVQRLLGNDVQLSDYAATVVINYFYTAVFDTDLY